MAVTPSTFSPIINTATNFLSNPTVQSTASTLAQGTSSASSFGGTSASGGGEGKTTIEDMIWAGIWANMKKMQEDSCKKLEEAMKKCKP